MNHDFSRDFVRSHEPLAKKLAKPYAKHFASLLPDIENIALHSVLEARKTHDASLAPFDYYARRQARWRIGEFLRRQRSIVYDPRRDVFPRADVELNAPLANADGASEDQRQDFLVCPLPSIESIMVERQETRMRRMALARAIETLHPRDRDIFISRRLAETPETLESIGKRYGISLERVRQLENRAANRVTQYFIDPPGEKSKGATSRAGRERSNIDALPPARDPSDNITRHAIVCIFGMSHTSKNASILTRLASTLGVEQRRQDRRRRQRHLAALAGLSWATGSAT